MSPHYKTSPLAAPAPAYLSRDLDDHSMSWHFQFIKTNADILVMTVLVVYFALGTLVGFLLLYLAVLLFSRDTEPGFHKLTHFFFRNFFWLTQAIVSELTIRVSEEIHNIRSSVIACNHVSYLDPILLISLFKRQKTIVMSVLFNIPIFGWVVRHSGYLPVTIGKNLNMLMIDRIQRLKDYLASAGNIFIFPEGTLSKDGELVTFRPGAFKMAKQCQAPIEGLYIKNTDLLYTPGRFLFNTCVRNTIEVHQICRIEPDFAGDSFSTFDLMQRARQSYLTKMGKPF
jgi:1-acyl-sn-glycerol-3-phosphate acyltransferase